MTNNEQTSERPAPMVPEWVDLRDFDYMPLQVRRLRDSGIAAHEDPEVFRASVLLWSAAWHQVPAASLPADDRELSSLSGFGRFVKEWRKFADAVMGEWKLCADGRYYHPVVAEIALQSWDSKCRNSYDRWHERFRKENGKRRDAKLDPLEIPSYEQWKDAGGSEGRPPEIPQHSAGIPTENSLKGSKGKGKGIEGTIPLGKASPSLSGEGSPDDASDLAGTVPKTEDPKVAKTRELRGQAREVLEFLNTKTGKRFPPTDSNVGIIVARLRDGFTPGQCRQVVAFKVRAWNSDETMREYLRPETLFGVRKFSSYVGELVDTSTEPETEGEPAQ